MNRGYAGYYKGFYLRSSYEYAYAIYLDYHKVNWTYEAKTFDIGYKIYKPDFFIFDQNGSLSKVVEIKSLNKEAKKNARMALERIKTLHGIDSELIYSSLVLSTPLNKVSTTISSMLDQIENSFGVKDLRVISRAVFGEDRGRKELLLFMKSVCNEKIC